MISSALQLGFASDRLNLQNRQFTQKQITDLSDIIYKRALTSESVARAKAAEPVISIPGTDIKLTRAEYVKWYTAASKDDRTAAIKNYEYAKAKGYSGSFQQFQDSARTTHQKDYEQAKMDGYEGTFNQWMIDMAKAGAINLGEIVQRKEATADVQAKKYFTDPKGLSKDVESYVNSKELRREMFQYADDPKKMEIETVRAKEKFIRSKITASGGEIIGERLDGRTFVFTVKWRDGTTSEVKYAN